MMWDETKTKAELIEALTGLRQRVAELEAVSSTTSPRPDDLFFQANLIQQVSDAVIATDMELRIKSWNRSAERMYGWQEHEVINRHLDDLLETEFVEEPQPIAQKRLLKKKSWQGLVRQKCKDGKTLSVMASVSLLEDDEGRSIGGVTVNRDETRRIQAEQQLNEYREQLETVVEARTAQLKQANEQLRQEIAERQRSEEAYRAVVDNSLQGLVILDESGNVVFANHALSKMSGYTVPELLALSPEEVRNNIHPADWDRVWAYFWARLAGEQVPENYQYRAFAKDRSVYWVETYVRRINYRGKPAVQAAFMDITDRKMAEQALQESERKFRSVVEQTYDAIVLADETGMIIEWNRSQEEISGLARAEVIGRPVWDVQYDMAREEDRRPGAYEQIKAQMMAFLETGQASWIGKKLEVTIARPDGSRRIIEQVAFSVQTDKGFMMGSTARDITARKRTEQALIESEEQYRSIFEHSALGIFRSTMEGKFTNVNPAMARMLGYKSPDEVLASIDSISEQIYADPGRRDEIVELLRGAEGVVEFENQYLRRDGREWTAHLHVRTVRDNKGEPVYLEGFVEDITARRQMEMALRESEERYRALVQASPSSVMVVQDERYVFVNPAGARMLGFSHPAELIGTPVLNTVTPGQQELLRKRLRRLKEGQTNTPIEMEVRRQDGGSVFIESTSVPITFQGQPAALVIGLDITERKQMEQKLQVSEARYRTLFEQANDAIFLNSLDDDIIDVNRRACELLGYTREELLALKVPDVQAPELRGQAGAVIARELEQYGEEPFETTDIHRDGTRIPVEVSTALIAGEAGQTLALSITRDITERKRVEEALRERETLFRSLFEYAPIGMAMTALDGRYLQVNQSLCDTLGYTAEELLTFKFQDFSSGKDLAVNLSLREKMVAGEINQFQMEKRFFTKQGKTVHTLLQVTLLRDQQKQPLYFIGQVVDITERKQVEETLQQRNSELALINRVSETLNSTLDLDRRLNIILEEVRQLLGVVACSIWLLDPDTDALICRQATGPKKQIVQGWRLSQEQGLVGWVARYGQSLIVSDAQNHPHHAREVDDQTGLTLHSILTIPLRVQKTTIGVLQAASDEVDRFSAAELILLESLATTAAIAIENARLYQQARQDAETKTMLLQEVNHRVGNNLTAITGMLALERRHVKEADQAAYQAIMADLTNRVMGLATVHNMLSEAEWTPLPLDELTRQVIHSSLQMLPLDEYVEVQVISEDDILVSPDQAHNLALAINELATNTLKYALEDRNSACITVRIVRDDQTVYLEYRDDGPGYPQKVLQLEQYNVGLNLIQKITYRLRGQWSLMNDSGAVTVIQFAAESDLSTKTIGNIDL